MSTQQTIPTLRLVGHPIDRQLPAGVTVYCAEYWAGRPKPPAHRCGRLNSEARGGQILDPTDTTHGRQR
jgi:hypothetical protein